jgi:hypothetical protein
MDTLSGDLEDGKCIPLSAETFEALRTFVFGERPKMAALPAKHDDRVMAVSHANIVSRQSGIGDILVLQTLHPTFLGRALEVIIRC